MSETSEKIAGFLKSLEFKKKVFGGVDAQDVLKKFSDLDGLYQAAFIENIGAAKEKISTITEQLQSKQHEVESLTAEIDALKIEIDNSNNGGIQSDKIQKLESQLSELQTRCDEAVAANALLEENNQSLNEQLQVALNAESSNHNEIDFQAMQNKINELSIENNNLKNSINDQKNKLNSADEDVESIANTLVQLKKQLMSEAYAEKERIIEEAHKEAEKIIFAAELDKEQIRIKSYLNVQNIKKEKEQLAEELNQILKQIQNLFSEKDTDMKNTKSYITEAGVGKERYEVLKSDELFGNAE